MQGPLIIKLDSNFEIEWRAVYQGGPRYDRLSSCSEISSGVYTCSGQTDTANNPKTGITWGNGATDVYILKIDAN